MYNSKIKDLIKKAKNKRIGAIPVGLKASFEGVKVSVEAQYEISGKVVIYIIGDGKNTVAKIDGSTSNKTLSKSMLFEYVRNNSKYNNYKNDKDKAAYNLNIKRITSKFVDELFIEVNVANGKSKYAVSPNMAIKNKVAANRKPESKKPVAKKPVAKKTVAKSSVTDFNSIKDPSTIQKRKNSINEGETILRYSVRVGNKSKAELENILKSVNSSRNKIGMKKISMPKNPVKAKKVKTPAKKKSNPTGNAYKYVYSNKKGSLVYAGTIKK